MGCFTMTSPKPIQSNRPRMNSSTRYALSISIQWILISYLFSTTLIKLKKKTLPLCGRLIFCSRNHPISRLLSQDKMNTNLNNERKWYKFALQLLKVVLKKKMLWKESKHWKKCKRMNFGKTILRKWYVNISKWRFKRSKETLR